MAKKQMTSISTKTGDRGETGLADGQRVAKDSLVMQVIGDLDELNSHLGVVISYLTKSRKAQIKSLREVQSHLYKLSALLAKSSQKINLKLILNDIEKKSLKLEAELQPVLATAFLYPGGVKAATHLDVARAVCRRAERSMVSLNKHEQLEPTVLACVNRLSDYLYLLKIKLNNLANQPAQRFSLKN